ncbi:hypothetical protein DL93DRAFT_2066728 [Clavulina sp. PMI_390]|nr:hypothetical protein DL93DRAFT_2066728 [Clavulina sp. PMI_390]
MSRYSPSLLTQSDINEAAVDCIKTFDAMGLSAAFVGGEACSLYGVGRKANDLDIFVLTNEYGQEELKRLLVGRNTHFYLVPARTPGATYKSIKVDVLLPGAMDIPLFPSSLIEYISPSTLDVRLLPVAPLKLVMLLKLQAWSQHRAAFESRFREKVPMDHRDLSALFEIAEKRRMKVVPLSANDDYIPSSFMDASKRRVREHLVAHPEVRRHWRRLGYDVDTILPLASPSQSRSPQTNLSRAMSASGRVPKTFDVSGLFEALPAAETKKRTSSSRPSRGLFE